jgi:hypothetical protein
MPSNVTELFPTSDEGPERRSRFQQHAIQTRNRVVSDSQVPARTTGDDGLVWRWEFPVCNSRGEVMRYVRVNARTEDEAVVLANGQIDKDRTLGDGIRLRYAIET